MCAVLHVCVCAVRHCPAEAADVTARQHAEAIATAEAQLQAASTSVTELRTQLAALSTDLRGQLAAKGTELDELQATNTALSDHLGQMEEHKRQAEVHAGACKQQPGLNPLSIPACQAVRAGCACGVWLTCLVD